MPGYPQVAEELIIQLNKFPGIGRRSAERIVYYLMQAPREEVKVLVNALIRMKDNVRVCTSCFNFSAAEVCAVCSDEQRDKETICVVEEPKDVHAVEKAGGYRGLYHVLQGAIEPLEGRGPDDIKVGELLNRLKSGSFKEVIIATDSDIEGEMTAQFIRNQVKAQGSGVRVSRIGIGLPMGANIEHADPSTVARAISARREVE